LDPAATLLAPAAYILGNVLEGCFPGIGGSRLEKRSGFDCGRRGDLLFFSFGRSGELVAKILHDAQEIVHAHAVIPIDVLAEACRR
jgi:hypothetical protein